MSEYPHIHGVLDHCWRGDLFHLPRVFRMTWRTAALSAHHGMSLQGQQNFKTSGCFYLRGRLYRPGMHTTVLHLQCNWTRNTSSVKKTYSDSKQAEYQWMKYALLVLSKCFWCGGYFCSVHGRKIKVTTLTDLFVTDGIGSYNTCGPHQYRLTFW